VTPPPAPPAQETDWKSLVTAMDDERSGLKKKLKRLFIRDKA
jgi:hypothetical protein